MERQRFVSQSSLPKELRLHWGRVQETVFKSSYAPHPRARPTLKPNVTYYEFLQEERWLQTSRDAHNFSWAFTSTPSCLGAQSSKSNKLESTGLTKNKCSRKRNSSSLARITPLATLSLESLRGIFKKWREGVRELLESLWGCSTQKMGKRELAEGV
jgi:hypothetical protein